MTGATQRSQPEVALLGSLLMIRLEQTVAQVLPPGLIRMAGKLRGEVRNRRAERALAPLVSELIPEATGYDFIVANDDAAVFRVRTGGEGLILKLATSARASELLEAEASALDELAAMPAIEALQPLVARVVQRGTHPTGTWLTQSMLPGTNSPPPGPGQNRTDHIVRLAIEALQPLHAATAVTSLADDSVLDQVVTEAVNTIKQWRPALTPQLTAINGECRQRLAALDVTRARSHGDYAPTNLLWDPETGMVSGIVDWGLPAALLPPEVDYAHFVLSMQMDEHRAEFGACVIAALDGDDARADEIAQALELGPNQFTVRTGATLAWLHHVAFSMEKSRTLRRNPLWLTANVDAVVNRLAPNAP